MTQSTSSIYIDGRSHTQPKDTPSRMVVQAGHHRDKLELIRDSLRPFEQQQVQETVTVNSRGSSVFSPNGTAVWPNEPLSVDKIQEQIMVNALMQCGHSKESAYYALKLVNFKSVVDAENLLRSARHVTSLLGNNHPPLTATASTNGVHITSIASPSDSFGARMRYAPPPPRTTEMLHYPGGVQYKQTGQQHYLGVTKSLPVYNAALPMTYNGHPAAMETSTLSNGSSTQFESSANSSRSESPLARNSSPMAPGGVATASVYVNGASGRSTSPVLQRMGAERRPVSAVNRVKAQYAVKPMTAADVDVAPRRTTQPTGTVIRIEQQEATIADRLLPSSSSPLRRTDGTPAARSRMPAPPPPTHIPATVNASDSDRIPVQQQAQHPRPMREGVQSIVVDPDRYPPSGYVNYVDQLRRKVENVQLTPTRVNNGRSPLRSGESPATSRTSEQSLPLPNSVSTVTATSASSGSSAMHRHSSRPEAQMQTRAPADHVVRCVSPLPESVARRLRNNAYERAVKPCRAPMFRFFMEQHTERIIQQYRERNQRAMQLTKEMEAAELADTMKDQMLRLLRQKESKYIRLKRQKMNKNMFEMIRHIGVGAFGKVTLVRKKDAGQIYAMKTLSKEDIIQKQQAAHVKAERDILAEANSVWIVRLYFSFQDAQNLYFIMEYVPGGDMMQLLINKGIFSERLARFYMAELTCALEYVHGLGFIHRDIKPDNILIDKHGHIKLTDFGLCTGLRWTHDKRHYVIYADDDPSAAAMHYREDSFSLPPNVANGKEHLKLLDYRHHKKRNQAHSVVGTGNYMAPEVILKTGHTQLCDWWSVGVICYEMVYGRPPFLSPNDNPAETQYMIVNWNQYLNLDNPMGARLSRDCVDFIASMCCDQTQRRGQKGAKDVKSHSWFSRIDFERLRSMKAEYIPRVEHAEDTSNFDTFEVNSDEFFRTEAPSQPGYNPAFFDFTFRNFFASEGGHQGPSGGRMPQRPSIAPLIASNMSSAPNPGPATSSTGSKSVHASSTTANASNAAATASATSSSNVTNFSTTSAQYAQRGSQNAQRTTNVSTFKRYDNRMTQVEEDDGSNDEEYVVC